MARRSTKASVMDDRTFAVRCRYAIPPGGNSKLCEMNMWLQRRVGRQGYAIHGAGFNGAGIQASYLYANDPAVVADCIRDFGLKVLAFEKQSPTSRPNDGWFEHLWRDRF